MKKKIVFLTGTRADFGKLKSLISILDQHEQFEVYLFVTGMHLDEKYGYTVHEIERCGFKNIYQFENHHEDGLMDITLAKTINGFSAFTRSLKPDLVIIHGDRVEALAGASVGALNNYLVAHIEGGELSGTVDELIRHAVSKLSHVHFVANENARQRLIQMGELPSQIFITGSPDLDVLLSSGLPSIAEVKKHYDIPFETFAISIFHPVTTEIDHLKQHAENYFSALDESGFQYVLIYPNNDQGVNIILEQIFKRKGSKNYLIYPSLRFEYFLTLLKNAQFIIGNSSAGIREAHYYNIPAINVGSRQTGRSMHDTVLHVGNEKHEILYAMDHVINKPLQPHPHHEFGSGNSAEVFLEILLREDFWETSPQKYFADISIE
ncbi:MAG: UDP-N-acetylglucosamine 2-epimerase (hydrolyzing) [Bacteroidetes bacterium]|nr:UDP-N-acetylglucosamine 2-epimerase (hydrolyzing) [Bacteroidota bacterium]